MGGTISGCTDRRCCGMGVGASKILDGKTVWTLNGIGRLPEGATCLIVQDGGIEPHCPEAVQNMMKKDERPEEFRALCGQLFKMGSGPPPDLEQVLIAAAPGFERTGIDIFLTAKLPDSKEDVRWFIFVDREQNPHFVPENAVRPVMKKKGLTSLLSGYGTGTYELEETPAANGPSFSFGRVDFGGSWREAGTEGDMDQFLIDMGWTKDARKVCKSLNYGVGRNEQHIEHRDNRITVRNVTPSGEYTTSITVGSGSQGATAADGRSVQIDPRWIDDGFAVLVEQRSSENEPLSTTKRYMRHNRERKEMVLEMTSPGGVVVRRVFAPIVIEEEDWLS